MISRSDTAPSQKQGRVTLFCFFDAGNTCEAKGAYRAQRGDRVGGATKKGRLSAESRTLLKAAAAPYTPCPSERYHERAKKQRPPLH